MDQIRNEMKLTASHSESVTIKPFGSNTGTSQVCNVVDLCIGVDGDGDAILSAISVPLISAPVQSQFLKHAVNKYPNLSTLQLADNCEGNAQIDMLIGASLQEVRGQSGTAGIHTKLGWVLSGTVNNTPSQSSSDINTTRMLKRDV